MKSVKTVLALTCVVLVLCGFRRAGAPFESAYAQRTPSQVQKQKPKPAKPTEEEIPQGQAHISAEVNLVNLNLLVTDPKGNIITGLKPENFAIYEDNVKQEITHFAPIEANVTVVMLVEFSRQVEWFIYQVWNALYGFAQSLRQGDWVAVIGYDIRPTILCDFTQNRSELQEALRRFTTPAFSESNLSDALIDALDRVEETEGKVAVLLISTGLDTFSKHTYDEALNKCKASNASVYAIGLGQSFRIRAEAAGMIGPETNLELLMSDNRLKSFAEYTGGEAYFPRFDTEFPAIFGNVSALLRNQYSVAYNSSNTKHEGKFRKIRVEVNTDLKQNGKPVKLKVQTRKGYLDRQAF